MQLREAQRQRTARENNVARLFRRSDLGSRISHGSFAETRAVAICDMKSPGQLQVEVSDPWHAVILQQFNA